MQRIRWKKYFKNQYFTMNSKEEEKKTKQTINKKLKQNNGKLSQICAKMDL